MSTQKNRLHTLVATWLAAERLEDTAENYERGVAVIMGDVAVSTSNFPA